MSKALSKSPRPVTAESSDVMLFDRRPLEIHGFRFTATGVVPVGRPSIRQYQTAFQFANASEYSSPYWVGALMAYGESRLDWKEKMSQAVSLTGLKEQTLHNYHSVFTKVQEPERQISPSFSHSAAVAKLDRSDQRTMLKEAVAKDWNVSELRQAVKRLSRRRILTGQARLEGQHRVIYCDAPWRYENRPPSGSGSDENFPTMSIPELCALPIPAHATPNAAMGFWVPAPLLYHCSDDSGVPDALQVIRAWDFTAKAQFIWDKVDHVYGNYVSVRHEILILCTRGSCTPDRLTPMLDSVVMERKPPNAPHSWKPPIFRQHLERLWDGPYLELFASERVDLWTPFGNDARLSEATA